MLRNWKLGSLILVAISSTALAVGCGGGGGDSGGGASPGAGGSSNNGGSAGTNAGGAAATCTPATCKAPPTDPGAGPGDGTGTTVLAMNKLYLGSGGSDKEWADVGYDIDGLQFGSPEAGGHCKPVEGAKKKNVVQDGPKGENNSFGKNIMPIILPLASDAPKTINDSISEGSFTVILRTEKLGAGAKYSGLAAELFAASGAHDAVSGDVVPPADWATYKWEPFPETLEGDSSGEGDALHSKVKFPKAYLADNVWVSGTKATVSLNLTISNFDLTLDINQAVVTAELGADHKSAKNGIISGVLNADQLIKGVKSIAGKVSSQLCEGTTLQGVLDQVKQASDIMTDGTQNPDKTCDGISIGLGFEAAASQIGKKGPPSKPGNGGCDAPN